LLCGLTAKLGGGLVGGKKVICSFRAASRYFRASDCCPEGSDVT